ncbi:FeoB-associated Cys-rich membrane protein [Priestia koreensis]|uniref:Hydrolase n=1 Tax=Priestia koreensis TaxID=284581 RepID=A0A0M0KVM2_9BACI|nr:FeoB-associated Cys-rich membrane protein [Priestia koreensis]KOO42875.1 hydrolase [Priestia koreensis]UNL86586.1 FeoB-associated Cys-rich membrane protein [Priestia koreensis]
MLASILLGIVIFAYATFMIVRFVKRSRQGKCAACELNKSCQSGCSVVTPEQRHNMLQDMK